MSVSTSGAVQADRSTSAPTNRGVEQPKPYSQQPPEWRPPLEPHGQRKEVPDLYPTKSGQSEDDMSQASVRKGFTSRLNVQNEVFSAHEMIHERLAVRQTLISLSSWFDEILQRRNELECRSLATSTYKPPSRVTLNEVKLANYVKDLAEPSVPLSRLSRNVPHGFRGEKLFEMLWAGGAVAPSTTILASTGSASYFSPRTPAAAATPSAMVNQTASQSFPRKSVEVTRAVWFIRALGAAELTSLRNKSAATIIPEMTSNLCSWMAKQIAELSLIQVPETSLAGATAPSPVVPTESYLNPRTPGSVGNRAHYYAPQYRLSSGSISLGPVREICSVLQSDIDEERWIAKWTYSLSLARHLQAQQLLDRPGLVRWVVESFAASNLVQLPFMLELVQEVLALILHRRCFVKPFLKALLDQISALDARFERRSGGDLRKRLLLLLRVACESNPDTLVSPQLWYEHASTLIPLLREMDAEHDATTPVYHVTADYVERQLRPRAERLLLKDSSGQYPTSSPLAFLHRDIATLDSFDMKLIDQVFLPSQQSEDWPKNRSNDAAWSPRVETILTWACSNRRCGTARQYLAATLIEKIRFGVSWDEMSEGSDNLSVRAVELEQHTKSARRVNIEPMLIKWLSDVELALASTSPSDAHGSHSVDSVFVLETVQVSSIVVLVGELARRGIFSYTKYLQRLIARGMTTILSHDQTDATGPIISEAQPLKDSLHLRLLRSLPLYDQPASVYQQRRQAIYGNRLKETYEEASERRALRELKSFLPTVFEVNTARTSPGSLDDNYDMAVGIDKTRQLNELLGRLWSASRFVRCKIFRSDLLTACFTRFDTMTGQELSRIAAVLERGQDFEALAQLLAALLLRPLSDSLARATYSLVIAFSPIWRAMDIMCTLNQLVRQQLNHSSSIRNVRQAIMASTALLRLRTLIEGTPRRRAINTNEVTNSVRQSVGASRGHVETLLDKLSNSPIAQHGELSDRLTELRGLLSLPDSQADEIIERAIMDIVLERHDPLLISPAAKVIEQLYLEASLEIDERHARWLSDLASHIEQVSSSTNSSDKARQPFFALLIRLVAQGTLNLQVAVDSFVLPCLLGLVKKLTDPAGRTPDAAPLLLDLMSFLSTLLAQICGCEDQMSWQSSRALGAQSTLLFTQEGMPSLLRMVGWLVCATENGSSADASQKATIEAFWRSVLSSNVTQIVFRQDPRKFFFTLKEACKLVWGCNPHRVADLVMSCLDKGSLLLKDSTTISPTAIQARLNGWDTSVVAMELVEIFERLQVVESSFQSRADSKTKVLAAGIFRDIFVTFPDLGPQFLRDCSSPALISKFADVGLKCLSIAITNEATTKELRQKQGPLNSFDDTEAANVASTLKSIDPPSTQLKGHESEVSINFRALVRMCEQQYSFKFGATDTDTFVRILQHVVTALEEVATNHSEQRAKSIQALFQDSETLDLLHLMLRFNCLWSSAMRILTGRLIKSILRITRDTGRSADLGAYFIVLIDTSGFVLDEVPGSLIGICISETEERMHDLGSLSTQRTDRFRRLSFDLESAVTDKDLFTACSADAALTRGWYAPGGPSPWECSEYVGAASNAAQAGPPTATVRTGTTSWLNGSTSGSSVPPASDLNQSGLPAARAGWPTKLALNTALPLSLLGVKVTRDLVPDYPTPASVDVASVGSTEGVRGGEGYTGSGTIPGISGADDKDPEATAPLQPYLESEKSYGDHTAGETLSARSIRRGMGPPAPSVIREGVTSTLRPSLSSPLALNQVRDTTVDVKDTTSKGASSDANAIIDLTWEDEDTDHKGQQQTLLTGGATDKTHVRDDEVDSAPSTKKRRFSKR